MADKELEKRKYEELIKFQKDKLIAEFNQIDVDSNGYLTVDELMNYLSIKAKANNKNAKPQDMESLQKLISSMDENRDNKISIDEFINSYIRILGELSATINEYEERAKEYELMYNESIMKIKEYKNEIFNREGISNLANLKIKIFNIKLNDVSNYQKYRNIEIKVYLGSYIKILKPKQFLEDKFVFDEEFDIPYTTKKQVLCVEFLNVEDEIESNKIDLEDLTNQKDYELDFEVNDKNTEKLNFTLFASATSIWNYTEKYQLEADMYKENLKKINDAVQKSRKVRSNLDQPFALLEQIQEKEKMSGNIINSYKKGSQQEYAIADNIENRLKSYLKMEKLKWSMYTKLSLYLLIALSFFNMFARADFINLLLPLYMLVTFISGISFKKMSSNLQLFLIANTFTLVTDLLWLILRDSTNKADDGAEDSIREFVYFTSIISFTIKILLVFCLWIQKLKVERNHSDAFEGYLMNK